MSATRRQSFVPMTLGGSHHDRSEAGSYGANGDRWEEPGPSTAEATRGRPRVNGVGLRRPLCKGLLSFLKYTVKYVLDRRSKLSAENT